MNPAATFSGLLLGSAAPSRWICSACSGFPSWSSRSPIYRGRWKANWSSSGALSRCPSSRHGRRMATLV